MQTTIMHEIHWKSGMVSYPVCMQCLWMKPIRNGAPIPYIVSPFQTF